MSNEKKPDFSDVQSGSSSNAQSRPDFSDVKSGASSNAEITGGSGGTGGTGEVTYTVVKGDTLSHIAKEHYGKASKWQVIFAANRDQLDDPDKIYPGQVLKIPPLDAE